MKVIESVRKRDTDEYNNINSDGKNPSYSSVVVYGECAIVIPYKLLFSPLHHFWEGEGYEDVNHGGLVLT